MAQVLRLCMQGIGCVLWLLHRSAGDTSGSHPRLMPVVSCLPGLHLRQVAPPYPGAPVNDSTKAHTRQTGTTQLRQCLGGPLEQQQLHTGLAPSC